MTDSTDRDQFIQPPARTSFVLALATSLLMCLVGIRCLVIATFDPAFDVDPLMDLQRWFGFGPGDSSLLSVLSLICSSVVLFEARLSGRGIDRPLLLLASLPIVPILLHGSLAAADMARGLDWFSAAIAAVAIAHAVRAPGLRALVLSTLLAILALVCMRGLVQIYFEHPFTIKFFESSSEDVLAAFGWAPDSEQARLYIRRLLQPEATGWFGLANIVSGLLAFGFVLTLSSVVRVRGLSGGLRAFLLVVVCGAFGWVLLLNGSKGAWGALVIGLTITCLSVFVPKRADGPRFTRMGWLAFFGVVVPAAVIFLRGAVLGESSIGGEKSLLFRWQYALGAMRVFMSEPYLGVGPDGLQSALLALKNPFNPEDPVSAHNVVLDWFATLGIFAGGWLIMLGLLVTRVGRSHTLAAVEPSRVWILFVAALFVAFIVGLWYGTPLSDPVDWMFTCLGFFFSVFVLLGAHLAFSRLADSGAGWCFAGSAGVLLTISMLDMVFFNTGSVGFCWAAFAAMSSASSSRARFTDSLVAVTPLFFAITFLLLSVQPLRDMDHRMESIASEMRSYAWLRNRFQYSPLRIDSLSRMEAMTLVLEESSDFIDPESLSLAELQSLAPGSNDPAAISMDLVLQRTPGLRRQAIDALVVAWDAHPEDPRPAWASIEQLRLLASESEGDPARAALLEAITRSESMLGGPSNVRAAIVTAWTSQQLALSSENPDWSLVVADFVRAIEASPHDPALSLGLADAARRLGDVQLETSALTEALQKDDRRRLDPLVQFPSARRAELERRLERLVQSSS